MPWFKACVCSPAPLSLALCSLLSAHFSFLKTCHHLLLPTDTGHLFSLLETHSHPGFQRLHSPTSAATLSSSPSDSSRGMCPPSLSVLDWLGAEPASPVFFPYTAGCGALFSPKTSAPTTSQRKGWPTGASSPEH